MHELLTEMRDLLNKFYEAGYVAGMQAYEEVTHEEIAAAGAEAYDHGHADGYEEGYTDGVEDNELEHIEVSEEDIRDPARNAQIEGFRYDQFFRK